MYSLEVFLSVAVVIFCIGIYGFLSRKNVVGILISIQLIFIATVLNIFAFSRFNGFNIHGIIFGITIGVIVMMETIIVIAVAIRVYKSYSTVDIDE